MMQQLFDEITDELNNTASLAPIMKRQETLGENWGYSICATPLEQHLPVIMGMNWGGKGKFEKQTKMPDRLSINVS